MSDDSDYDDLTLYWSDSARVEPDGAISMRVSGAREAGTILWSGRCTILPGQDDYLFWGWLVSDPIRRKGHKSSEEIELLKATFSTSLISD
jgi:hypothetical protein